MSWTKCSNSECPIKGECTRWVIEAEKWQTYLKHHYFLGSNGVTCEFFLPHRYRNTDLQKEWFNYIPVPLQGRRDKQLIAYRVGRGMSVFDDRGGVI